MALPNLTTAETNYDPKLKKNAKVIFNRKDQEDRWKVTEQERAHAKNCKYPNDLHDFNNQVCVLSSERKKLVFLKSFGHQLKTQLLLGYKSGRRKYLYFDSAWLNG
jgi:hypothetical protein